MSPEDFLKSTFSQFDLKTTKLTPNLTPKDLIGIKLGKQFFDFPETVFLIWVVLLLCGIPTTGSIYSLLSSMSFNHKIIIELLRDSLHTSPIFKKD